LAADCISALKCSAGSEENKEKMMSHAMKVLTSLCLLVDALGTPPPIETPPMVYSPFELSSSDLCQRECKKTVVVNFESTFMAGDIVGELSDVNGVDVMPMGTCNIKVNAQSAGGGKGSPSGVVPPDIFQNSAMIFTRPAATAHPLIAPAATTISLCLYLKTL